MSFYLRPGSTSSQSDPSKAVLSGRLISNPTEEQLLAHGWTVYVQPEQVPQDPPLSLYQSLRTQYHAGFKSFRDYQSFVSPMPLALAMGRMSTELLSDSSL